MAKVRVLVGTHKGAFLLTADGARESWREIGGNLPTDFGFPIEVHAQEPLLIVGAMAGG